MLSIYLYHKYTKNISLLQAVFFHSCLREALGANPFVGDAVQVEARGMRDLRALLISGGGGHGAGREAGWGWGGRGYKLWPLTAARRRR